MDITPNFDASFPAQSVAYTGTAGSTSGWTTQPAGVLVWSTTDCYVAVGNSVTATSNDMPLPAYTPITITNPDINKNGLCRVSAIQISAGGTIYAKPVSQ